MIGSWLTSIVIVPFARWRHPFTTAYVIVALPFSPAGGVYTAPSYDGGPATSAIVPFVPYAFRSTAIGCW